ncbi:MULTISPECIES: dTDP-glucose pyrophosphorylase [unclassified Clostridium]|uniref:dTDP-glucose pyrophosphorylase n=1 Tax=unclassified Clostridium TaxID=2614128 RepID=UPI000297950C|nr:MULTISPECIES: dTDP-glucose pyrophosphorylase [unclassified Clostridium]EKQ50530.1 MAG: dTDP-glucose pyrophosphorylase [Clostridium sp. Maddingley MBC34-26]
MNIIIPMAGAGQRFADEGYKIHKPAIPTIDRRTGKELPMVVCATMDLPNVLEEGLNVTYIDRTFHKTDGVEKEILKHYPKASFITVENLTEGQACTCMLARDIINNDESLLIAGCDNGMVMDNDKFNQLSKECDVIVFTYRNNEAVLEKPNAYGWVKVDENNKITGLSIKKAISDTPMNDHAIVATFWFKKGSMFVEATKKMIDDNDRVNNEFYVDQTIKHILDLGYDARVFEIDRYIGWGTPKDYEEYTSTIKYWMDFLNGNSFLGE